MDALRRTGLLDTRPDERFDRITRMAANHLDAPVAMLKLVDERRQWTKSAVGLPQGLEVDRAGSICTQVIEAGAPVLVPDAANDPRVRDIPMVAGADGVACYLGVPVRDTTGTSSARCASPTISAPSCSTSSPTGTTRGGGTCPCCCCGACSRAWATGS